MMVRVPACLGVFRMPADLALRLSDIAHTAYSAHRTVFWLPLRIDRPHVPSRRTSCDAGRTRPNTRAHTFLPTLAGFLYLAVVLDAWSRRIVGWAFSTDLKTRVVLDALDMALAARKPDNVVHHSDSQRINASFRAASLS